MELRIQDVPFEEDCLRMPTVLRNWTRYIDHLVETAANVELIISVYDRAVASIPFSYKLWKSFIEWSRSIDRPELHFSVLQRAAEELPRFPCIWLKYAEACTKWKRVDLGMWVLDHSLRHLAITQHERIWDFFKVHFCGDLLRHLPCKSQKGLIVDIWSRWLQLHPNKRDGEFCESMIRLGCVDEAAIILLELSVKNGDNKALSRLLELLADNPQITVPDVDTVIKQAIKRQPNRCGALWNILSARAIQRQDYRTAQAIFEQALESIISLEDFCLVFEAYSIFLETLCSAFIETNQRGGLYLAKLEHLLAQRKLLLHNVLVRLQPSNVNFWLQRIELIRAENPNNPTILIPEFEKAVKTVNSKMTDQFHLLWMAFARLYSEQGDLETAYKILEHACSAQVRLQPEDHACLLIEYSKFRSSDAMLVLALGCVPQSPSYKTLTFWNYLLDFQEAIALRQSPLDADSEPVKALIASYNKVIELRLATVQTFINYAEFVMLVTRDSNRQFAVYERGISAFGWPIAFELWNVYLPKAMIVLPKLPLGVERLRDLFEQALHKCPDQFAAAIVILYCKFEDENGLARNCLRILDSTVKRPLLGDSDRADLYKLFIARTKTLSGVVDLRAVYERAVKALSQGNLDYMVTVAIEWARLEASMGEMIRCRSLLVHVAEQAIHNVHLWSGWEQIEQEHGDERTYRDMLRLKKAITEKHAKRHGSLSTSFVRPQISNDNEEGLADAPFE